MLSKARELFDLPLIVCVFILFTALEYSEAFTLVEDELLSYRQAFRHASGDQQAVKPLPNVRVIYTDEAFYDEYQAYPLRREDLGTLILRLKAMGAAVIGVDMLLDSPSAYGEDPALAGAMASAGNVLLVSQAEFKDAVFQGMNYAIPDFTASATSGYSNISSNSELRETMVRLRVYPEVAEQHQQWPFSVEAVSQFLGVTPRIQDGQLTLGDSLAIQLDQFNDFYIDFPKLKPRFSGSGHLHLHEELGIYAGDILFVDEEELMDLAYEVDGNIVLLGEVAEVAHDQFETPVGNIFGVNIIASQIDTLLKGGPLRSLPYIFECLIALVLMGSMIGLATLASPLLRNSASFAVLGIFVIAAFVAYIQAGWVVSMTYNLAAIVTAMIMTNIRHYLFERGQKAYIREAFGQYLSPAVVEDLVKDPEKLSLGGEEREMTAYFSDIAGFSSFSESMTPTELVNLLNEYLTAMCDVIIETGGTIDKFEGDAIIAFWGAPLPDPNHARQACFASLDMRDALGPLGEKWLAEGRPQVSVRMGLNTGPMVVGNMGSTQRVNYTIMGDAVNLASRLEGANKAFKSDLMISEATYLQCADEVDVRELDVIRVVGKDEPIRVYQLLNRKHQTTGVLADMVDTYHRGLEAMRNKEFEPAAALFDQCLSLMPNDGPSEIQKARASRMRDGTGESRRGGDRRKGPRREADWDGVFTLTEKG